MWETINGEEKDEEEAEKQGRTGHVKNSESGIGGGERRKRREGEKGRSGEVET